jgi:CRISPR-associated protein Cas1
MYALRFPNEDVSSLTMQELRGREGARIRGIYRSLAKQYGVKWNKREYDPENFAAGDDINQALSLAHQCLYGLAHSVIGAFGCSPALGFVHAGGAYAFVYDLADIYKAEVSIPAAFEVVSAGPVQNIEREVRRKIRDLFYETKLIRRMATDLRFLLNDGLGQAKEDSHQLEQNVGLRRLDDADFDRFEALWLWDEKTGKVASGVSYAGDFEYVLDPSFRDEAMAFTDSVDSGTPTTTL